jgi:hypothetical protein
VLHATGCDQPPALGGSPAIAAVDRHSARRSPNVPRIDLPSADVMAEELRAAAGFDTDSMTAVPMR